VNSRKYNMLLAADSARKQVKSLIAHHGKPSNDDGPGAWIQLSQLLKKKGTGDKTIRKKFWPQPRSRAMWHRL
jgi:hypothetical protein